MTDNVTNELLLEHLKRLQSDMSAVRLDVGDLKRRMTGVEEAVAGQSRRLDRVDERLDRIERRLELSEDA